MSLTLQAVAVSLEPAIKGIQALRDLLKGDDAKAQASNLYDVIITAQLRTMESYVMQTAMIERIRDLEEELRNIETWDTQKDRYQMAIPIQGCTVYALKESKKENELPH